MFDGLLGRKFFTKCKTNLKLIKVRLDKINKRRNSVQKFFRADIANLLKNNLDINAYGRAEALLVEINMSSCYEMIENFCASISTHLSTMDKHMECPDECREAVPSLMYAAARFADLPELRDLRNVFATKYGGSSLEPYVSKEFVQRLKLPPPTKEQKLRILQEIVQEASLEWDSKSLEQKLYTPTPPEEQDSPKYKYGGSLGRVDDRNGNIKRHQFKNDDTTVEGKKRRPDEEVIDNGRLMHNNKNASKSSSREDDIIIKMAGFVPPPTYYAKVKEASPFESSDSETSVGTANSHLESSSADENKEKRSKHPVSVRRNRVKTTLPTQHNGDCAKEDTNCSRPEIEMKDKDEEEEEERLDDLLQRFSKKGIGGVVPGKERPNMQQQQPPPYVRKYNETIRETSIVKERKHIRGYSLPPEEPTLFSPRKAQCSTRAASSFEPPDVARVHVHPNLPSYEDLASRIASLTGS